MVRDKLQTAPRWVWSLIEGVSFGAFMTVFNHAQHPGRSWTGAIVGGIVGGVLFGAVMGPVVVRQRRKASAVAGHLPARDLRAAGRAVNRGPAPADPQIRQAAERLATHQMNDLSRTRPVGVALFSLGAVGSAVAAISYSPWWWIAVAGYATFVAACLMLPRHLQRRIKILTSGTADPLIVP